MRRKYCSATFLKTMQKSRRRELVARVISVKMSESCFPILNFLRVISPCSVQKDFLIYIFIYTVKLIELLYITFSSSFNNRNGWDQFSLFSFSLCALG